MRAPETWAGCLIWRAASASRSSPGRNTPMRGTAEFPAEWRKISDDLPGVGAAARIASARIEARGRLPGRAAAKSDRRSRILALGPLTNIAEALQRDPSHRPQYSRNRHYGRSGASARQSAGRRRVSHQQQTAEWNMFVDPLAASHRVPVGRAHPADRAGCDQQGPDRPRIPAQFASKGAHSPLGRVSWRGCCEADGKRSSRHLLRVGSAGGSRAAAAEHCENRRRCISTSNKTRHKRDEPWSPRADPTRWSPWTRMPPRFRALFLEAFTVNVEQVTVP